MHIVPRLVGCPLLIALISLQVSFDAPVALGQNLSPETSCRSSNGNGSFSHPDNQRCQTRRPYRRGR